MAFGSQLFVELSDRRLPARLTRLDRTAGQADLPGVVLQMGRPQSQRQVPLAVVRIEQHQHGGRSSIRRLRIVGLPELRPRLAGENRSLNDK